MKTIAFCCFVGALMLGAQTVANVSKQLRLESPSTPGFVLLVQPDQISLAPGAIPAAPGSAARHFIGSATSPGCVAVTPPGTAPAAGPAGVFTLPAGVTSLAVYRNGLRSSTPGEYTLSGSTLTFVQPILNEAVVCDYIF